MRLTRGVSLVIIEGMEIYTDIPNLERSYQVSDHGGVRSLDRTVVTSTGVRHYRGRVFSPYITATGYSCVVLRKNTKRKLFRISRLVLLAFRGPPPPGYQACHCDGVPSNNHLSNLRWDTPVNNHADKVRHGTVKQGEDSHFSKLSEAQVYEIIQDLGGGVSRREIAHKKQVHHSTISDIACGRSWSHLTAGKDLCIRRKLSKKEVLQLLRQHQAGIKTSTLAKLYHITTHSVCNIVSGRRWSKVTGIVPREAVECQ